VTSSSATYWSSSAGCAGAPSPFAAAPPDCTSPAGWAPKRPPEPGKDPEREPKRPPEAPVLGAANRPPVLGREVPKRLEPEAEPPKRPEPVTCDAAEFDELPEDAPNSPLEVLLEEDAKSPPVASPEKGPPEPPELDEKKLPNPPELAPKRPPETSGVQVLMETPANGLAPVVVLAEAELPPSRLGLSAFSGFASLPVSDTFGGCAAAMDPSGSCLPLPPPPAWGGLSSCTAASSAKPERSSEKPTTVALNSFASLNASLNFAASSGAPNFRASFSTSISPSEQSCAIHTQHFSLPAFGWRSQYGATPIT